jgi:hypothetical protein
MPIEYKDGDGAQALDQQQDYNRWQYSVVDGCAVSPGTNDMTVQVAAGTILFGGTKVDVSAQDNVALDPADSTYPRKDLIYLDSDGTLQVERGGPEPAKPSTNVRFQTRRPAPPELTSTDAVVVAEVWVEDGVGDIASADVRDRRFESDLAAATARADELYTPDREPDVIVRELDGGDYVVLDDAEKITTTSSGPTAVETGIDNLPTDGTLALEGTFTFTDDSDTVQVYQDGSGDVTVDGDITILGWNATIESYIGNNRGNDTPASSFARFHGEQVDTVDLSSDAAEGDETFDLNDVSNIQEDYLVVIRHDVRTQDASDSNDWYESQLALVRSTDSNSSQITTYESALYDYNTADSARVEVMDPIEVDIHGLDIVGNGRQTKEWSFGIKWGYKPRITGIHTEEVGSKGPQTRQCYAPTFKNNVSKNMHLGGDGYGIQIGGCHAPVVKDNLGIDCRHFINITGGTPLSTSPLVQGNMFVETDVTIRNSVSALVEGNYLYDSNITCNVESQTVRSNVLVGDGVIQDRSQAGHIDSYVIEGNTFRKSDRASVSLRNEDVTGYDEIVIRGNEITGQSDAAQIWINDYAIKRCIIEDNVITATGDRAGILVADRATCDELRVAGNHIEDVSNAWEALDIQGQDGAVITDNVLRDIETGGGAGAIRVIDCTEADIKRNRVEDPNDVSWAGLDLVNVNNDLAGTVVADNDFSDVPGTVINEDGTVDVSYYDNLGNYGQREPMNSVPTGVRNGQTYLDDGTNRDDDAVGYRKYDGSNWQDIAAKEQNSGDDSQSGDGSATSFTIAHGLSTTPTYVDVTPSTEDAIADHYVTADGTNITINYAAAPPSGTDNLGWWWEAEV